MWLMQLGEVVFGGVGSGLYGMLVFAVIAVFMAGLMIGRTPEYLGKKLEPFEMKNGRYRSARDASPGARRNGRGDFGRSRSFKHAESRCPWFQ